MNKSKKFSALYGIVLLASVFAAPSASAFAVVGDGWDGVGLGSFDVKYNFGALTTDNGLTAAAIKSAFVTGFDAWSGATNGNLTFTEVFTTGLDDSIDISWEIGAHGDGFPFGPTTLAHAFYPEPPNPNPIAGDLHMNDAFSWEIGNILGSAAYDITIVAAHEIGHAIGMGHSGISTALMFPTVSSGAVFSGLDLDDIAGLCTLYDCVDRTRPVPAPATLILMAIGMFGLSFGAQRRRQHHKAA